MKKLKSLSIFFPSLNDAKILPYLISRAYTVALEVTPDFEIIIINDGSTDETIETISALQKYYPKLRLVNHKKNLGYGAALASGFNNSKKEWIFYTDGDGQYDPRELMLLVKKLKENIDVVNGYKLNRNDSILRRFVGSMYNGVLHLLYPLPISDIDCDFRLMRRSLIQDIKFYSTSGIICFELISKLEKAGAHFSEVGVHHHKRQFGSSQFFRPYHLLKTLIDTSTFLFKTRNSSF